MAYQKQTWRNLPDRTTPITAARLEHMETQYEEAIAEVDPEAINNKISTINNTLTKKADLINGKVPASQISGVPGLSANLIDKLRFPLYIAHRGSRLCYPEHSWEAYRASYEAGFTPEADVRALADGTLVCLHDSTTNRTMDIQKTVTAVTVEEWRNAKVKPPVNPGSLGGATAMTGSGWGTPVFFEDYLDEFGGKCVLWPEIKITDTEQIDRVISAVAQRGLHRAVVLQCNTLAVAQSVVAAGVCAALSSGSGVTPADAAAAGVEFMIVPQTQPASYYAQCEAAGIRAIAWTTNTRAEANKALSRGASGVFSDDPWEVSRQFTPVTSLDLSKGYLPPAMQWMRSHSAGSGTGSTQRLEVANNTFLFLNDETSPYGGRVRLGMFGFDVGNSMTMRLTAQAIVSNATNTPEGNWMFGVYLGKQVGDVAVNEDPLESQWRLAVARRDGRKNAYEKRTMTGAVNPLGAVPVTTPPYAKPGGRSAPMDFEVQFTPTSVQVRNLTLNDDDLVASNTSLSIPGSYVTLCVNGAVGRVYNISVKTP